MSVPRGTAATKRLRALLDQPQPDAPYLETAPLPAGFSPSPPDRWLWDRPVEAPAAVRPALRDPRAYALVPDTLLGADLLLHQPPDVALAGEGGLSAEQQAYARASLDVTMKGGTTSGVVYPLALCELARRFRLRNIGGASAGAIAASLAAAAELGRTRWDAAGRPELRAPTGRERQQGRLRPGFVGLADATAWFSQVDDPGLDEYRIAQLFRPTDHARSVFRLVVAAMRGRWTPFGALLLWSFGRRSRVLNALVLLLAPVLAVVGTPAPGAYGWVRSGLFAALALALGTAAVICGLATVITLGSWLAARERTDRRLREPVVPRSARPAPTWWPTLVAAVLLVVVLAVASRFPPWGAITGWRLLGAWFFLVVAVVVVQLSAVLGIVGTAKKERFGLVSGSVGATTFRARGRLWDAVAGLSAPTLDDALVPWLDRALSDLAGSSERSGVSGVLRFGHLWLGEAYAVPDPSAPRTPDQRARLEQAADTPRARTVNLELMTTEVVHGLPCRFPLRRAGEQLFLRRHDLLTPGAETFPPAVVDALCPPGTGLTRTAYDIETGQQVDDLYPLPEPWDLPVVFATRLSLALPGLFQAVRVYRVAADGGQRVRDDYGARVRHDGADVAYPGGDQQWVEELWFSDGGITSNFPIHLFDTPLPLWPTVGINLGTHPRGFAQQDVWLPTSSGATTSPSTPQRGSLLGFAGAVVDTALGWSDTSQTFMPAFRGRVAWVRQRADEGGNNLYMTSATIASLALRGALAGHRIAERYGSDAHWRVHQWLRLRVALDNLAALHGRVGPNSRTPPYSSLDGPAAVEALKQALEQTGGDPDPAYADGPDAPLEWYDEGLGPEFFAATAALLGSYTASPGTGAADLAPVRGGVPEPAAELRQVPPG